MASIMLRYLWLIQLLFLYTTSLAFAFLADENAVNFARVNAPLISIFYHHSKCFHRFFQTLFILSLPLNKLTPDHFGRVAVSRNRKPLTKNYQFFFFEDIFCILSYSLSSLKQQQRAAAATTTTTTTTMA
jgi:predicted permease